MKIYNSRNTKSKTINTVADLKSALNKFPELCIRRFRIMYINVSQYSFDYEIPENSNYDSSDLYYALEQKLEEAGVFVEGIDTYRDVDDWGELSNRTMRQCGIDFIDINRNSTNGVSVGSIVEDVLYEFGFVMYADEYETVPYYGIEREVAEFYGVSVDELIGMLEEAGYTVSDSLR